VLIERRAQLSRDEFIAAAHPIVASIYSAALALPATEPTDTRANPSALSNEEWMRLFLELQARLRDFDSLWVAPGGTGPSGPGDTSLSDDLADLYRDLKDGLALWHAGNPQSRTDAIWEWRFGFENHWGRHALSALRDMHRIRTGLDAS
jgi:hypothetical protein